MAPATQIRYWLFGFLVVCVLLYLLSDVLFPFVAGMAAAYLLDPTADKLESWGCSRTLATSLITGLFIIVALTVILLVAPVLADQIVGFLERAPGYIEAARNYLTPLFEALRERFPIEDMDKIRDAAGSFISKALTWLGRVIAGLWTGGVVLINILSLTFITPIVTFYLLRDWDRIVGYVDESLPRGNAEVIRGQLQEIDRTLAGFVRGQLMVCLVLGVFYAAALSIVGLEFGLVVGLAAGAVSFIPFVGAIFGFVVSVGLAILQFSDWVQVGIVAAIFVVGQALEGNFLTPKLVGDKVGLHPVWIMFALLAGGALLGFVGVLLAVPIAAVIGVLLRFGYGQYLASPLYGVPPAVPDGGGSAEGGEGDA